MSSQNISNQNGHSQEPVRRYRFSISIEGDDKETLVRIEVGARDGATALDLALAMASTRAAGRAVVAGVVRL